MGYIGSDGSELAGGLNPSSVVAGLKVDANGNLLVVETTQQGYIAAWGTNPAATTPATDTAFKWGAAGTTAVNRVMLQNNTAANVQWDFDVAATAGSPILGPGQTIFFNSTTQTLHLLTAAAQNINGNVAGNIVVRGWQ